MQRPTVFAIQTVGLSPMGGSTLVREESDGVVAKVIGEISAELKSRR